MLMGELAPLSVVMLTASLLFWGSAMVAKAASWPTQKSQSTQPRTVPALPQLTTVTGETHCWYMPTKEQTNMATEEICWTMTVESATRGQKS